MRCSFYATVLLFFVVVFSLHPFQVIFLLREEAESSHDGSNFFCWAEQSEKPGTHGKSLHTNGNVAEIHGTWFSAHHTHNCSVCVLIEFRGTQRRGMCMTFSFLIDCIFSWEDISEQAV